MTGFPHDGELTLELDAVAVSGWQSIRVTRSIERCPSDFDVQVTEKFPGSSSNVVVAPGQVCRIKIGSDLVLTGYVDGYAPSIEPEGHTVQEQNGQRRAAGGERAVCLRLLPLRPAIHRVSRLLADDRQPRGFGLPNQQDGNSVPSGSVIDPGLQYLKRPDGQKRNRVMSIITEQWDYDHQLALATERAKWEMARRYGRSHAVRVEVDSWRDSKGKLWEPNFLVPIELPALKVTGVEWILSEVSYIRDDRGTRAELVAMAPEAFQPEPVLLNPFGAALLTGPARDDQSFNPRLNEPSGGV